MKSLLLLVNKIFVFTHSFTYAVDHTRELDSDYLLTFMSRFDANEKLMYAFIL